MTYRLFDEMDYLKRKLASTTADLHHIQQRIEVVEQSLFSSLTVVDGLPVIVAHIMYQCAIEYGVEVGRMRDFGESRGTELNAARNLAIFRISELGSYRMGEIAAWFNINTPLATAAKAKGKLIDSSKKVKA